MIYRIQHKSGNYYGYCPPTKKWCWTNDANGYAKPKNFKTGRSARAVLEEVLDSFKGWGIKFKREDFAVIGFDEAKK